MRSATWMKDLVGLVVDEAHCVIDWGKEFRRDFDDLDKTRSYMSRKPIFFCTATLTPDMLEQLTTKLTFPRRRRFLLNLGNERHNITPIVCRMKGPTDYDALTFLLDEAFADPPLPLIPTLIYADTRETVRSICRFLINKLPQDSPYRNQIDFIYSSRHEIPKAIVLAKFMKGLVSFLVGTEAVGMVRTCNISAREPL